MDILQDYPKENPITTDHLMSFYAVFLSGWLFFFFHLRIGFQIGLYVAVNVLPSIRLAKRLLKKVIVKLSRRTGSCSCGKNVKYQEKLLADHCR